MALSWNLRGSQPESAIYVEEWAPAYGGPYLIGPDEDGAAADVVLMEDGDEIRPHLPAGEAQSFARIAFVDGVRRVEAALYQHDPATGQIARGIAGSAACGAVCTGNHGRLEFGEHRVYRLLVWGSGTTGELPEVAGGWQWRSLSIASDLPDAPLHELQTVMREEEGRLAESLWSEDTLVIVDGPLNFVRSREVPVLGYVKTHHRALLPAEQHMKVPLLGPGERTSVFAIGEDRYSCYLRLTWGTTLAGPWSGIVRLEVPQAVGANLAIAVADEATRMLPSFAGVPHRDARAPQNLQPIGSLETHLRHLLGDSGLANRAVREAVALKSATAQKGT